MQCEAARKSAIARYRQPFRRAGLAAVVLRGELHHGAGVAVAGTRCYTVRPGDTLSAIAARAYRSAAGWPAV